MRLFARYLATIDPQTEVPSKDLLPATRRRLPPYIYSPMEVAALMRAARTLGPRSRAATIETLIGLMAATGLRLGEALRLDRADIDVDHDLLRVHGKHDKQRELPLHATTVTALRAYMELRDSYWPRAESDALFLSRLGVRLTVAAAHDVFPQVIRAAGLEGRGHRARPRPHDLRHAFAVSTLLDWHHAGVEIDPHLPLLSTYLGHRDPSNTFWYLQATPELAHARRQPAGRPRRRPVVSALAPTLQAWFTERSDRAARRQPADCRRVSRHAAAAVALRLGTNRQTAITLDIADLDAPLIGAFLDHLEHDRGNSPRTRNARLAAIHSLYRFTSRGTPSTPTLGRVLEIPPKRHERATVSYLDVEQLEALLAAPNRSSWIGRRDHAMMLTAVQAGLRVSELVGLRIQRRPRSTTGAAHPVRRQRLVFILHLLGLIGGDAGSSGASRRACGAGGRVRRAVRRAVRCVRWPCGR